MNPLLSRHPVSADGLLVLLTVARLGRFTSAGRALGLNHTTVARKIEALEKSLGGAVLVRGAGGWQLTDLGHKALEAAEGIEDALAPLRSPVHGLQGAVRVSVTEGLGACHVGPALARLQTEHPKLSIEIMSATRRAAYHHRAGLDLEIVVGEEPTKRAGALHLTDYTLALYASADYLERAGTPETLADIAPHPVIYYVDSILDVDSLDALRRKLPATSASLTSTNIFIQLEATRAGGGFAILPCFLADRHEDLVRVLPDDVREHLSYWMVARPQSLRRPAVAAVVNALREHVARRQGELMPDESV